MTNDDKRARVAQLYARFRKLFPTVPDLTVSELDALRSSTPVVLVDVRADRERAVSTIPGALSVREFERREEELTGRTVVAFCTIGLRSGRYAGKLLSRGWQAFNLAGSILAWTHAGRELAAGDESTRTVHVYGPSWDLAADDYDPVW